MKGSNYVDYVIIAVIILVVIEMVFLCVIAYAPHLLN